MNRDQTLALLERLRVAQLRLAAVALVVMMCVTVIDVFLRYVFNSPIRSSYDMVEAMMVLFVFNGMSTAFLQRRNIVIDLVNSFAGRRLVGALIRLSDVLTVAVLALFIYAMLTPALQSYGYGERKLELGLPIYIEWVAALIGIVGATLCAIGVFLTQRPPSRRAGRMNSSTLGAIGVLALFVMLFLRVPVWIALTLVGFIGNAILSGLRPTFALAGTVPFDVGSAYTLSVVPLFVLMGEVASESRLSGELFKAARVILSGFRGGLASRRSPPRPFRRCLRLFAGECRDYDAHGAARSCARPAMTTALRPAALPPVGAPISLFRRRSSW